MYSQVTICVNDIREQTNAVKAALAYAEKFQATVTAVYIKLGATEILRWQGSSYMDMAEHMLADIDQREHEAREKFKTLAQAFNCETVWHTIAEAEDPIKEMLCTDLFFADQPNKESNVSNSRDFLNSLILETKRPVIMIPREWHGDMVGRKVLLGWNSSPEAMRAASDALPFMQAYGHVTIIDVLKGSMSKLEGQEMYHIQDYLNKKRVGNQLVIENCDRQSEVPKKMLEYAHKESADLIVIGGYGHSRIREVILGGVTDHLIKHATLPVFLSH